MRALLLGVGLVFVASSAAAQRVDRAAAAGVSPPLTLASASFTEVPAVALRPWLPAPEPARAGMSMNGGRIAAILIGAVIGGGIVYGSVRALDCRDCDGDTATYGAAAGAVVGGFIGSVAYSFRQRRAVTPPESMTR